MTPKGFQFSAVKASIKPWNKEDVGLIVSQLPCAAAGVFTTNRVKAAPVLLDMKHMKGKTHRAILANSGCANAATGKAGYQDSLTSAMQVAELIGCKTDEVFVASTGVIGVPLPMEKITGAMGRLNAWLDVNPDGFTRAIMTTDTKPKSASATVTIGGKETTVWGCAKGAGMFHPNMATMLAFIVTDASVSKTVLKTALKDATDRTFNRATVDGDTSTNDTALLLANGAANGRPVKAGTADYKKFLSALSGVCASLADQLVLDGEGVTRLGEIFVERAASAKDAVRVARSIAGSLLVKTALNGGDPNWGRIVCAAGYSGVRVVPEKMELYFGEHCAFKNGTPTDVAEKTLADEFTKKRVVMRLVLNMGKAEASYLFSDISHEYVSINAHYRT
ncbi:MAG: bifunctional glutamate N-acetyltransferase/amino-acid acetyltransferase ArgJ [Nitrospinae bacterium]|nr:bifunctional glutamate N-acetyltransferase/amino-acid acetyltransferase ArgJ [Nitrospinota bacterium]